jgi:hypothetical protein
VDYLILHCPLVTVYTVSQGSILVADRRAWNARDIDVMLSPRFLTDLPITTAETGIHNDELVSLRRVDDFALDSGWLDLRNHEIITCAITQTAIFSQYQWRNYTLFIPEHRRLTLYLCVEGAGLVCTTPHAIVSGDDRCEVPLRFYGRQGLRS